MNDFLQRYLHGQQYEVWADLLALGQDVHREPLFTEAMAVARETMFRVRYNICLLVSRLNAIGYHFGYQWAQSIVQNEEIQIMHMKSPGALAENLRTTEGLLRRKQLTEDDIQRRLITAKEAILHVESSTRRLLANFPPLALNLPSTHIHNLLKELEDDIGTIPLSLYAWYEMVGSVNFIGDIPESWLKYLQGNQPQITKQSIWKLDPLFVDSFENIIAEIRNIRPSKAIAIRIAPDKFTKNASSGGSDYAVAIPDGHADALLLGEEHHTTFVNYLRICFQWGGFPGWEQCSQRPEEDLAFLTDGLLPI